MAVQSKFRVKKFDPSTIKPYRVILVVGKRGTGKSTLLFDLLYRLRDKVDTGIAMTPTLESAEMFARAMPEPWIYNNYYPEKLDEMVQLAKQLVECQKPRSTFVALDDCMYDKRVLKGITIRDIHMNGRHFKMCFINAMQYVMDMPPDLRTQVDYIFALKENILSNKAKLWKYFFGMFANLTDFCTVMDKCTANHECLVLDNTVSSTTQGDCIFWYKADHTLPPFRMGKPVYWSLAQRYRKRAPTIAEIRNRLLQQAEPSSQNACKKKSGAKQASHPEEEVEKTDEAGRPLPLAVH